MRFVIAALQCAAVCSLELPSVLQGTTSSRLQRRQALQGLALGAATAATPAHAGGAVVSDEVSVTFKEASLGMQLDGLAYQKTTLGSMPSLRCVVTAVAPGSEAAKLGVSDDWTVVSVNGANVESLGAKEVASRIAEAPRPLSVVFRDAERFTSALEPGSGARIAKTTVLPPTGPYTEAQVLEVERLQSPPQCSIGAERGDLLEVRYEGRLRKDNKLFDGSAITFADGKSVPGRGGDSSLYFVLGKQPVGQFPPAWDAAMAGCCVGEVRKLAVPPVLGFGEKGAPKRGVPPYAPLDYTIQLLGINGNNQPR